MSTAFRGYLRLARPANLPTALADILAGAAISGWASPGLSGTYTADSQAAIHLVYLGLASVSLYAGGVVLNDVFDYRLDIVERPERPLPKGQVSVKGASLFGAVLLLLGVVLSFLVHALAGMLSIVLALAILLYDAYSKKYDWLGPINMGVCRAVNLLLGISLLGTLPNAWLACIPLLYIFAITVISRGEVHGKNKAHLILAGILYGVVSLVVLSAGMAHSETWFSPIPFVLLFALWVFTPLFKAYRVNSPEHIKKAVKAGVIALIILDAALAVGFAGWWYGLCVLLLLPMSVGLAKLFAVT